MNKTEIVLKGIRQFTIFFFVISVWWVCEHSVEYGQFNFYLAHTIFCCICKYCEFCACKNGQKNDWILGSLSMILLAMTNDRAGSHTHIWYSYVKYAWENKLLRCANLCDDETNWIELQCGSKCIRIYWAIFLCCSDRRVSWKSFISGLIQWTNAALLEVYDYCLINCSLP